MRTFLKNIGIFVVAMALLALIAQGVRSTKTAPTEVGLSEVAAAIEKNDVQKIEVNNVDLRVTKRDGTVLVSRKEVGDSLPTLLRSFGITSEQLKNVNISVTDQQGIFLGELPTRGLPSPGN